MVCVGFCCWLGVGLLFGWWCWMFCYCFWYWCLRWRRYVVVMCCVVCVYVCGWLCVILLICVDLVWWWFCVGLVDVVFVCWIWGNWFVDGLGCVLFVVGFYCVVVGFLVVSVFFVVGYVGSWCWFCYSGGLVVCSYGGLLFLVWYGWLVLCVRCCFVVILLCWVLYRYFVKVVWFEFLDVGLVSVVGWLLFWFCLVVVLVYGLDWWYYCVVVVLVGLW